MLISLNEQYAVIKPTAGKLNNKQALQALSEVKGWKDVFVWLDRYGELLPPRIESKNYPALPFGDCEESASKNSIEYLDALTDPAGKDCYTIELASFARWWLATRSLCELAGYATNLTDKLPAFYDETNKLYGWFAEAFKAEAQNKDCLVDFGVIYGDFDLHNKAHAIDAVCSWLLSLSRIAHDTATVTCYEYKDGAFIPGREMSTASLDLPLVEALLFAIETNHFYRCSYCGRVCFKARTDVVNCSQSCNVQKSVKKSKPAKQ